MSKQTGNRKRSTVMSSSDSKKKADGNGSPIDHQTTNLLSHDEVRTQLEALGEKPGPIDDSNRALYDRLLTRKRPQATTTDTHLSTTGPLLSTSRSKKPAAAKSKAGRKGKEAVQAKPMTLGIEGVIVAAYTPFERTGELNLDAIEPYADYLTSLGVAAVFVNGTAGEGLKMTLPERMKTAEKWIESIKKRTKVIIHVGSTCLKDAQELACHAQSVGADAIATLAPLVFTPANSDELTSYLEELASYAPDTPLYYYHNPELAPAPVDLEKFLLEASSRVPTLAGVKFTEYNLDLFARCLNLDNKRYEMMYGRDEQLLGAMAMGAKGCIGSTYNFTGTLCGRIFAAFKKGDLASAQMEQGRSQAAIKLYKEFIAQSGSSPIAVGKAMMSVIDCSVGFPRLPNKPLSDSHCKQLKKKVEDLGLFNWL